MKDETLLRIRQDEIDRLREGCDALRAELAEAALKVLGRTWEEVPNA